MRRIRALLLLVLVWVTFAPARAQIHPVPSAAHTQLGTDPGGETPIRQAVGSRTLVAGLIAEARLPVAGGACLPPPAPGRAPRVSGAPRSVPRALAAARFHRTRALRSAGDPLLSS